MVSDPSDTNTTEPVVDPSPAEGDNASPENPSAESGTESSATAVSDASSESASENESTPDADDSSDASASANEPSAEPRRKVTLNPTVTGTSEFKAIPNPPVPTAGVATEASNESGSDETSTEAFEMAAVPSIPSAGTVEAIEIPPDADIDAAMEAEINALMQNEEQAAPAVVAASESQGSADSTVEDVPETGARIKGTVQSVHGENVFLDLGFRSPGVLPIRQVQSSEPPAVGTQFEVIVSNVDEEEGLIAVSLPGGRQKLSGDWNEVAEGQVVDCTVQKTNKGGLQVTVGSLRGFLPAGQIDLKYVDDLEPFVDQKLTVKIIEANREKRNLVVSRRAYLQEERKEAEKQLWETIKDGQEFSGTVKTIKNYGAFVDIGGMDGFLHIGEISWNRINHPSEVLKEGQTIDVKIVNRDEEKKRISLSMKQMVQNPWATVVDRYEKGSTVSGKVTRAEKFGAFVQLEPGIEGLIHISELDYRRVNRVADVVSIGQEIEVQVVDVDPSRRRIGLSLKALQAKPEAVTEKPEPEEEVVEPRKPKGPLKGGIGPSDSGGGLFGNPNDYS